MVISSVKMYFFLFSCYLIYSLALVAGRLAGNYALISIPAILLSGLTFFLLGVFATFYQSILRSVPLTKAYAGRVVTILYGMIFGSIIFSDKITLNMLLGTAVIITGVVMVVKNG